MSNTIDCPICQGEGNLKIFNKTIPIIQCHFCDGLKKIEEIHLEWMKYGEELKRKRISKRLTLKQGANSSGIDVSILSDMEMGKIKPNMDLF